MFSEFTTLFRGYTKIKLSTTDYRHSRYPATKQTALQICCFKCDKYSGYLCTADHQFINLKLTPITPTTESVNLWALRVFGCKYTHFILYVICEWYGVYAYSLENLWNCMNCINYKWVLACFKSQNLY